VVAFPWSDGWYWDGVSGFCVMYWLFINYCGYYFALAVVLCRLVIISLYVVVFTCGCGVFMVVWRLVTGV